MHGVLHLSAVLAAWPGRCARQLLFAGGLDVLAVCALLSPGCRPSSPGADLRLTLPLDGLTEPQRYGPRSVAPPVPPPSQPYTWREVRQALAQWPGHVSLAAAPPQVAGAGAAQQRSAVEDGSAAALHQTNSQLGSSQQAFRATAWRGAEAGEEAAAVAPVLAGRRAGTTGRQPSGTRQAAGDGATVPPRDTQATRQRRQQQAAAPLPQQHHGPEPEGQQAAEQQRQQAVQPAKAPATAPTCPRSAPVVCGDLNTPDSPLTLVEETAVGVEGQGTLPRRIYADQQGEVVTTGRVCVAIRTFCCFAQLLS